MRIIYLSSDGCSSDLIISNAVDEELELDIDAFLETARISVIRDGARLIILDPWNELEHKRGRDETTTEYNGRAIRKVKAFAKDRKSVVEGKRVSVRVDVGGRRSIKKKNIQRKE